MQMRFLRVFGRINFLVILIFVSISAHSDEHLPGGATLFGHSGYNYGPSVIDNGTTEKFWWCGYGTPPSSTNKTDVIYYTTYDWGSKQWGAIVQVLAPNAVGWDKAFTCDPSVIQGSFVNPDDHLTYGYAMYYTATDQVDGTVNSIGIAFSNDGINWIKYSGNPIIRQQVSAQGVYGAGQAATYNFDGKAGIYIFHTDDSTSDGQRMWLRVANDGIHFGAPLLISNQSSDRYTLCTNNDIAYDYNTDYFYGAIETCGTSRSGERETYQFGLYRITGAALRAGQGQWEPLGYINSAMTGFDLNHSPGLKRDGWGNLTSWLPMVYVYFAGGTNDPNTWGLTTVGWTPTPSTYALNRYAKYPDGHWVSTGYVGPGYNLESTLGYLFMTQVPNTRPIYSCELLDGIHHFISIDSACENQKPLGVAGWIYLTSQADISTVAIYRCSDGGGDHFASLDPNCEGTTVENQGQPLGYAKTSP